MRAIVTKGKPLKIEDAEYIVEGTIYDVRRKGAMRTQSREFDLVISKKSDDGLVSSSCMARVSYVRSEKDYFLQKAMSEFERVMRAKKLPYNRSAAEKLDGHCNFIISELLPPFYTQPFP